MRPIDSFAILIPPFLMCKYISECFCVETMRFLRRRNKGSVVPSAHTPLLSKIVTIISNLNASNETKNKSIDMLDKKRKSATK
jgi:hypothetical protein